MTEENADSARGGRGASLVDVETIPGVRLVRLKTFEDARGSFTETYREEWFAGLPRMLQANRSESRAGVLRGLHFHRRQADYWVVTQGQMLAVLVDLRAGSPTEERIALREIDPTVGLYIPPGVAHGYYAAEDAVMTYLVDRTYDPSDELGVAWDDPDLSIPWPFQGAPILSPRDQQNPRAREMAASDRVPF